MNTLARVVALLSCVCMPLGAMPPSSDLAQPHSQTSLDASKSERELPGVTQSTGALVERSGLYFTEAWTVIETAVQVADGGWVVGGSFNAVQGWPHEGIAKLLPSGQRDSSWDARCAGSTAGSWYSECEIKQIELGSDGWLYVLGRFSQIGGLSRPGLARLDPQTGAADPLWNPAASVEQALWSFALLSDGLVLSGSPIRKFALDGVGAELAGFSSSVSGRAVSVSRQALFANAPSEFGVVKLDPQTGSVDSTWSPGISISTLFQQAGDLGYLIGTTPTDGASSGSLVKLSLQGSPALVQEWAPPPVPVGSSVARAGVLHVASRPEGQQGSPRARLLSISLEGQGAVLSDVAFPDTEQDAFHLLAVDALGHTYVTHRASDEEISWTSNDSNLARLQASGQVDAQWITELYRFGTVRAVDRAPDGSIYVGGTFDRINGVPRAGLARLTPQLQLDAWQRGNTEVGISTLAVDIRGDVYVGGSFGGPIRLMKLSGADGSRIDSWNPWAGTTPRDIGRLLMDRQRDVLYVLTGYQNLQICGGTRSIVARVSTGETCTLDTSFGVSLDYPPSRLLLHGDSVYLAGGFTQINGEFIALLARVNQSGAVDSSWNPFGLQVPSSPLPGLGALVTERGLVVTGSFSEVQGSARAGLAMFDFPTGSLIQGWASSENYFGSSPLGLLGGDVLVAKPAFAPPDQVGLLGLVPLQGSGASDPNWPSLGIRAQGDVGPLPFLSLDDSSALVLGKFSRLGGQPTGNAALVSRRAKQIFDDGFEGASPER